MTRRRSRRTFARDGINVSVSDVAYHRLGLESRGLGSVVRASVHYYNSEIEVDTAIEAVAALAAGRWRPRPAGAAAHRRRRTGYGGCRPVAVACAG